MSRRYAYATPQRRISPLAVLIVLIVAVLIATFARTYARWESQPPEVAFSRDFKALGRTPVLAVTVRDPGTGLKHVTIRIRQKDHDVALADEALNRDAEKTYDIGKLIVEKYKIQEGPASFQMQSFRS